MYFIYERFFFQVIECNIDFRFLIELEFNLKQVYVLAYFSFPSFFQSLSQVLILLPLIPPFANLSLAFYVMLENWWRFDD